MKMLRLAFAMTGLALAGCEAIVNPVIGSSSTTGAANGATGTSGTSGTAASSSTGGTEGSSGTSSTSGTEGSTGTSGDGRFTCPYDDGGFIAPDVWLRRGPADSSPIAALPVSGGTDNALQFPTSQLKACTIDGRDAGYFQDAVTYLVWAKDSTGADGACGQTLGSQHDKISRATAADLMSLLDFGGGATFLPSPLTGSTEYVVAGNIDGGVMWNVSFDTGAFSRDDAGASGATRCMAGAVQNLRPSSTCGQNGNCRLVLEYPEDGGRVMNDAGAVRLNPFYYHDASDAGAMTWANALHLCNTLQFPDGGPGDWRLASYKELATLVNFTGAPIGDAFIDGLHGPELGIGVGGVTSGLTSIGTKAYWSSTELLGGQAMIINFGNPDDAGSLGPLPTFGGFSPSSGEASAAGPSDKNDVMCVRTASDTDASSE